jgi:hypothetical protein
MKSITQLIATCITPLSTLLLLFVLLPGCVQQQPPEGECITPPPTATSHDKEIGTTLSADLAALKVNASFAVNYKNIVTNNFKELNDANTALYIFLKAIECFSKGSNPVQPEIAQELTSFVIKEWSLNKGVPGFAPAPRPATLRGQVAAIPDPYVREYVTGRLQSSGFLK